MINSMETSVNTTFTVNCSQVVIETLSQSKVKCNLGCMMVSWTVASFNFYLIMFLANTFEQVYKTALFLGFADIIAYAIGGVLVKKTGVKRTLIMTYLTAMIGGLLILFYGLQNKDSIFFPLFFFIARLGTSSAFGFLFTGNNEIFPAEIAATSMSIC